MAYNLGARTIGLGSNALKVHLSFVLSRHINSAEEHSQVY